MYLELLSLSILCFIFRSSISALRQAGGAPDAPKFAGAVVVSGSFGARQGEDHAAVPRRQGRPLRRQLRASPVLLRAGGGGRFAILGYFCFVFFGRVFM